MILRIYVTIMPVVLGGIINMFFVRTNFYKKHKSPIDRGATLSDGRRIFGDNKTWVGFFGMIVFTIMAQIVFGYLDKFLPQGSYIYTYYDNNLIYNALVGFFLGLSYVVCELPNSFIKRRISIPDGKTASGAKGLLFFLVDQIDSLLGAGLVLAVVSHLTIVEYFIFILVGAGTHIFVNLCLFMLKIRKNL